MAKGIGYINAELFIQVQGADATISIGEIQIPLKFVSDTRYQLAVDYAQVKDYVEAVYGSGQVEGSNGRYSPA